MKFDVKEIKKAITKLESLGGGTEMDIKFDVHERLIIAFSEPLGGDNVVITIFPSQSEKMATITITQRL